MIDVLKPSALVQNDSVGVVATSFPFPFPEDESNHYFQHYKRAVSLVNSLGFNIQEAKNLRNKKWWCAGTAQERASDINEMFADQNIKAIMVHDGGESAITVLEYIDYDLVKRNPKPFIGFSDITNIHSALFTKTGLVGFHGPLLTYSFGRVWKDSLPENVEAGKQLFLNDLTSTKPIGERKPLTNWENWRGGRAEGQLFGGNISMLASLVGTPYFPSLIDLEGVIFFWEIDNSPSYKIEKALYQLKYAGVLDVISCMLVGKLPGLKRTAWEGLEEPSPKEIITEILKEYNFPIIGELDFGHETVDFIMPIGLQAKVDADNLRFEILEAAVR